MSCNCCRALSTSAYISTHSVPMYQSAISMFTPFGYPSTYMPSMYGYHPFDMCCQYGYGLYRY